MPSQLPPPRDIPHSWFQDLAMKVGSLPFPLKSYVVAGVPAASDFEGHIVYISDETGGKTIAFSDGVNWRRVQDRAIIS